MKTETVIVVFRCDTWHTYNSYELIGVATSKDNAVKIIKTAISDANFGLPKNEHCKLSKDDERNLHEINQTQNMQNFDGEFIIEEKFLNT